MGRVAGWWLGLTVVAAGLAAAGCGDEAVEPECGNGILEEEAGEQCDDGNRGSGDGCDFNCQLEAHCGDDVVVEPEEECDDGNLASGDGCDFLCRAEECGNSRVDPGEQCDDGNTTAGDGCDACMREAYCGDGMIDADEDCDEGEGIWGDGCGVDCTNVCDVGTSCDLCGEPEEQCEYMDPFDGCGVDCREEVTFVVSSFEIATSSRGCDMTGDGVLDNGFANTLGDTAVGAFNGAAIESLVPDGEITLLMPMLGLDDLSGQDDDALGLSLIPGEDTDDDLSNNFEGEGEFTVPADMVDADGVPEEAFDAAIEGGELMAGPADLDASAVGSALLFDRLAQARVEATVTEAAGSAESVDGLLCSVVSMNELHAMDFFFPLEVDRCDGEPGDPSLLDVLVGGAEIMGIEIGPGSMDVDLDGDGLESFEVVGGEDCLPSISACIDGDGTRIEGADCVNDERMADGMSLVLEFTSVRANIVGTH
ncbi:MAG: DUF4215 domain-containing protein [Myxococcota bacterium]